MSPDKGLHSVSFKNHRMGLFIMTLVDLVDFCTFPQQMNNKTYYFFSLFLCCLIAAKCSRQIMIMILDVADYDPKKNFTMVYYITF